MKYGTKVKIKHDFFKNMKGIVLDYKIESKSIRFDKQTRQFIDIINYSYLIRIESNGTQQKWFSQEEIEL